MRRLLVSGEGGQAMVEVALLVSIVLMPMIFGLIEMGFLFSSHLTISATTREGARMGSSLANGGNPLGCGPGQSPNAGTVDQQIIASVERSLTGVGTEIALGNVSQIRIFRATASGGETAGMVNVWTYSPNLGPVVDGDPLDFVQSGPVGWQPCSRSNVIPADTLGITIKYTYQAKGPVRFFLPGLAVLQVSDTTVMALNATQ